MPVYSDSDFIVEWMRLAMPGLIAAADIATAQRLGTYDRKRNYLADYYGRVYFARLAAKE